MSNNCLVTKLKGTVDNESLLKFGAIKVSLHIDTDFPEARPVIFMRPEGLSEAPVIRIIGNYVFTDNGLKTHPMTLYNGVYTLDANLFPVGRYDIEIPNKNNIKNIRFVNAENNGGMYLNNHRGDAIVYNFEDLKYSNSIMGLNLAYQLVEGDLHKVAEVGLVDNIDRINISDNYVLKGTFTDLFKLSAGVFEGKYSGRNSVYIESKQRRGITGSMKDAIDWIASVAVNGVTMRLRGFDDVDMSGIDIPEDWPQSTDPKLYFTFDGNGGYTTSLTA